MVDRMLQFVRLPQQTPQKRAAPERREDFAEIYRRFDPAAASAQASRCSQCGIPFCSIHCPLSNHIPDWLKLCAEGRLEEAYEVSSATNNFPEICGRICPQDRLCEGNCVIEKGFESVTIGAVERHITDTAWVEGWVKPLRPRLERPQSVGIIGAGPGGLAAAEMLRGQGYKVHVYDRYDRVGGLMIYGIPGFKLEKEIVLRRWRLLEEGGIQFHLGQGVGEGLSFDELRARHETVLIATGVYKPRDIGGPGAGLGGIVPALDYLTASNRQGLGDSVPAFDSGALDAAGKRVVVIGGGDTAMDCVRTAVRQSAASVQCLYRRDQANMPGSMREVKNAQEEGVEFVWLSAPEAFLGDDTVSGVRVSAHAAGYARRLGPPIGGAVGRALHGGGGSGDQGAGLRPGAAAPDVGHARARGEPLGYAGGGPSHADDHAARCVRRRRYRARGEPRGVGDQGRARRGRADARVHAAKRHGARRGVSLA